MNNRIFQHIEYYNIDYHIGLIDNTDELDSRMKLNSANIRFNTIRTIYTSIRDSFLRILEFLDYDNDQRVDVRIIELSDHIRNELENCKNSFINICTINENATIGIFDNEVIVEFIDVIPHLRRINQNVENVNRIIDVINRRYR